MTNMDIQQIEHTPHTKQNHHIKAKQPRKSKWQQILGYEQDHHTAKHMFKISKLLPPPKRTQQKQQKNFKRIISQQKLRVKSIFKRIFMDNAYTRLSYSQQPNLINIRHVTDPQCQDFIAQMQPEIMNKFKKLTNQSAQFLQQYQYDRLQQFLEKTNKWITKVEERVQEKFRQKITSLLQIKQMKQKYTVQYQKYIQQFQKPTQDVQDIPTKLTNANSGNSSTQNQQAATVFNMKLLQQQIMKLMEKEQKQEQLTSAEVDSLYLKSCKEVENSDSDEDADGQEENK